ncbi:neutral zinc metallopeptidase [Sphaerisporangium krabiense]|uniref:neutral zinc metallopeptidase n=1 Tax=Sphaerisporangium krabiense TaxID=763782 RepID=UPI001622C660|nr:neutral zinc metallopeptidase [Sphaerisporangium krabiense]
MYHSGGGPDTRGGPRVGRGAKSVLTIAVVSCLAVAATGETGLASTGKTGTGAGTAGTARTASTTSTARTHEVSRSTADDMGQDISTALYVVNRYWSSHWRQFFTGRYTRPTVFGGYARGYRRPPVCGGKRLGYQNAFYCRPGDYIAWDLGLMRDGYASGDAWVYLIIAHEWGHAVQARLNAGLVSRAKELQADCLAGAVLYGAAYDGTLRFESGDVEELSDALTELADETPWTDVGDHGNATQRVSSFTQGARYGVYGCLPSS